MKKLLLSFLFIGSLSANAQNTIFEDSFETYPDFLIDTFGNWNSIDVDLLDTYTVSTAYTWPNIGDPMAAMVFNPSATTPALPNATNGVGGETENRNVTARTGSKYVAFWGGSPEAPVVANNDWLISPPITLGSAGNVLSFWVKALSDSYGLERYRVGIYVGTGTPTAAQFTYLAGNPVSLTATYPNWSERTISTATLNTYNGQTVRFGIQYVSADVYMMMVDDFKVTTTALSTPEFSASKFFVYPNPASSIVSVSNNESILISEITITDMNGRTVQTTKVDGLSNVELNVADLSSGVYFMNLTTDSGKAVKKFIKS